MRFIRVSTTNSRKLLSKIKMAIRTSRRILGLFLLSSLLLSNFTACANIRSKNGVMIEKQRNWNPLYYIPYL